jgi:hypothetical protein
MANQVAAERNRMKRRDKKRTTKMVVHMGGRKLAEIKKAKWIDEFAEDGKLVDEAEI